MESLKLNEENIIEILKESRDINEAQLVLRGKNVDLSKEEIKNIKKQFNKTYDEGKILTFEQLENIAGGGVHIYLKMIEKIDPERNLERIFSATINGKLKSFKVVALAIDNGTYLGIHLHKLDTDKDKEITADTHLINQNTESYSQWHKNSMAFIPFSKEIHGNSAFTKETHAQIVGSIYEAMGQYTAKSGSLLTASLSLQDEYQKLYDRAAKISERDILVAFRGLNHMQRNADSRMKPEDSHILDFLSGKYSSAAHDSLQDSASPTTPSLEVKSTTPLLPVEPHKSAGRPEASNADVLHPTPLPAELAASSATSDHVVAPLPVPAAEHHHPEILTNQPPCNLDIVPGVKFYSDSAGHYFPVDLVRTAPTPENTWHGTSKTFSIRIGDKTYELTYWNNNGGGHCGFYALQIGLALVDPSRFRFKNKSDGTNGKSRRTMINLVVANLNNDQVLNAAWNWVKGQLIQARTAKPEDRLSLFKFLNYDGKNQLFIGTLNVNSLGNLDNVETKVQRELVEGYLEAFSNTDAWLETNPDTAGIGASFFDAVAVITGHDVYVLNDGVKYSNEDIPDYSITHRFSHDGKFADKNPIVILQSKDHYVTLDRSNFPDFHVKVLTPLNEEYTSRQEKARTLVAGEDLETLRSLSPVNQLTDRLSKIAIPEITLNEKFMVESAKANSKIFDIYRYFDSSKPDTSTPTKKLKGEQRIIQSIFSELVCCSSDKNSSWDSYIEPNIRQAIYVIQTLKDAGIFDVLARESAEKHYVFDEDAASKKRELTLFEYVTSYFNAIHDFREKYKEKKLYNAITGITASSSDEKIVEPSTNPFEEKTIPLSKIPNITDEAKKSLFEILNSTIDTDKERLIGTTPIKDTPLKIEAIRVPDPENEGKQINLYYFSYFDGSLNHYLFEHGDISFAPEHMPTINSDDLKLLIANLSIAKNGNKTPQLKIGEFTFESFQVEDANLLFLKCTNKKGKVVYLSGNDGYLQPIKEGTYSVSNPFLKALLEGTEDKTNGFKFNIGDFDFTVRTYTDPKSKKATRYILYNPDGKKQQICTIKNELVYITDNNDRILLDIPQPNIVSGKQLEPIVEASKAGVVGQPQPQAQPLESSSPEKLNLLSRIKEDYDPYVYTADPTEGEKANPDYRAKVVAFDEDGKPQFVDFDYKIPIEVPGQTHTFNFWAGLKEYPYPYFILKDDHYIPISSLNDPKKLDNLVRCVKPNTKFYNFLLATQRYKELTNEIEKLKAGKLAYYFQAPAAEKEQAKKEQAEKERAEIDKLKERWQVLVTNEKGEKKLVQLSDSGLLNINTYLNRQYFRKGLLKEDAFSHCFILQTKKTKLNNPNELTYEYKIVPCYCKYPSTQEEIAPYLAVIELKKINSPLFQDIFGDLGNVEKFENERKELAEKIEISNYNSWFLKTFEQSNPKKEVTVEDLTEQILINATLNEQKVTWEQANKHATQHIKKEKQEKTATQEKIQQKISPIKTLCEKHLDRIYSSDLSKQLLAVADLDKVTDLSIENLKRFLITYVSDIKDGIDSYLQTLNNGKPCSNEDVITLLYNLAKDASIVKDNDPDPTDTDKLKILSALNAKGFEKLGEFLINKVIETCIYFNYLDPQYRHNLRLCESSNALGKSSTIINDETIKEYLNKIGRSIFFAVPKQLQATLKCFFSNYSGKDKELIIKFYNVAKSQKIVSDTLLVPSDTNDLKTILIILSGLNDEGFKTLGEKVSEIELKKAFDIQEDENNVSGNPSGKTTAHPTAVVSPPSEPEAKTNESGNKDSAVRKAKTTEREKNLESDPAPSFFETGASLYGRMRAKSSIDDNSETTRVTLSERSTPQWRKILTASAAVAAVIVVYGALEILDLSLDNKDKKHKD